VEEKFLVRQELCGTLGGPIMEALTGRKLRRTRFGTRETPPCQKAILLSKDIEGTL
jgi:hypothetical protein